MCVAYGQVSDGIQGPPVPLREAECWFDPKREECLWRQASSDVGLQTLQAVHALHVALNGGLARDWLGTLGQEPPSLPVAQSLALVPT